MNRATRRRTAALALVSGTMFLASGFAAPGGGSVAGADSPSGCNPSQSAARVARGMQGVDPNSVTPAQAQRMDARLQQQVHGLVREGTLRPDGHLRAPDRIIVPTHVHVITASDGSGTITQRQIQDQIRVMNDAYGGRTSAESTRTPFTFELVSTDVTVNDDWYEWSLNGNGSAESRTAIEAKTALHQGGWGDLNIYIANLSDGLLGYATFPRGGPLVRDGLVLLNESLPGGSLAPFNEGDTATHETGHWLGLYHTFQNGCAGQGDYVADTPYQDDGENIFFCNESDDTCPQPGTDPVHNFMSYGDDPCLDRFTQGQDQRMIESWLAYRA